VKYLLGEASPEEEQAVMEWMNGNAANKEYYIQLQKVWDNSKKLAADSTLDADKAWERFQKRVAVQNEFKKISKHSPFSWMRIAASIILIAGLGIVAYFMINNNGSKELVAQTGQYVLVDTLPDGSVVTLNKRSVITYPSKFKGNSRAISLKGEAFFNVAPDKKKPFIISVNDVQVTVVGTSKVKMVVRRWWWRRVLCRLLNLVRQWN